MQATLNREAYAIGETLYMAMELSARRWKLCFGDGRHRRQVTVPAGERGAVLEQIRQAKERFGLAVSCGVLSGYEVGRDGFWIHRWLGSEGIGNLVMDSSSIEVPRRARVRKTDRLDAGKLLALLVRWASGERGAFSVVRVPSAQAEADRRVHRERERLVKERKAHRNRIQSLLITQGVAVRWAEDVGGKLEELKVWDGSPLAEPLREELEREWARLEQVERQLKAVEAEQRRRLAEAEGDAYELMRQLRGLCSIDVQFAWVLVREVFGWREFSNRRELAGCVGLAPTPSQSGASERELGIGKSGNRRVRAMLIELAWMWLRHQPQSELAQWFERRYAGASRRQRRIGIVALARKLVVALWRYLQSGELPAGARLKAA